MSATQSILVMTCVALLIFAVIVYLYYKIVVCDEKGERASLPSLYNPDPRFAAYLQEQLSEQYPHYSDTLTAYEVHLFIAKSYLAFHEKELKLNSPYSLGIPGVSPL